jgi:hypothetical protein
MSAPSLEKENAPFEKDSKGASDACRRVGWFTKSRQ